MGENILFQGYMYAKVFEEKCYDVCKLILKCCSKYIPVWGEGKDEGKGAQASGANL